MAYVYDDVLTCLDETIVILQSHGEKQKKTI